MKKLIFLLALTGCFDAPSPERLAELRAVSKDGLAHPEQVGVLPDRRIVYRSELQVPCGKNYSADCAHTHYVYFVGGTITDNHVRREGKSTVPYVQATVDESGAKTAEEENLRALIAAKAKADREHDLETLRRLRAQYGDQP